ncbi:hypothetical protein ABKN59_011426 [Abortiporus biennis]
MMFKLGWSLCETVRTYHHLSWMLRWLEVQVNKRKKSDIAGWEDMPMRSRQYRIKKVSGESSIVNIQCQVFCEPPCLVNSRHSNVTLISTRCSSTFDMTVTPYPTSSSMQIRAAIVLAITALMGLMFRLFVQLSLVAIECRPK